MATILELARHAEVSPEDVLRVLNHEPVSSAVEARVERALEELGQPPYPGTAVEPLPVEESLDRARRQLLASFAETAAELEAKLPEGVGSVVYEALRVEVRPVSNQLAQMGTLVDHLLRRMESADLGIQRERKERLDDIALITELITTGWRTVDRRLGRLERMVEELVSRESEQKPPTRYVYMDEPPGQNDRE